MIIAQNKTLKTLLFLAAMVSVSDSASAQTYVTKCTPNSVSTVGTIIKNKVLAEVKKDGDLDPNSVKVSVTTQILGGAKVDKTYEQLAEGLTITIREATANNYAVTATGQANAFACIVDVKYFININAKKKDGIEKYATKSDGILKIPGKLTATLKK